MKNILKPRFSAGLFGWSIILMTILAALAYGFAHTELRDLSISDWENGPQLLLTAIIGWIGIAILDLLVSLAVFGYFRRVSFKLALSSAFLRLVYTLFLLFGIFRLMETYSDAKDLREDIPMNYWNLALDQFESIWSFGLIIFGFHLVLLGIVSIKANIRFWGVMLILAGICYVFVHGAMHLGFNQALWFPSIESLLTIPMTVGELGFGIWLLVRGRNKQLELAGTFTSPGVNKGTDRQ